MAIGTRQVNERRTQHRTCRLAHLSPDGRPDALVCTQHHAPPGSPPGTFNRVVRPEVLNPHTHEDGDEVQCAGVVMDVTSAITERGERMREVP